MQGQRVAGGCIGHRQGASRWQQGGGLSAKVSHVPGVLNKLERQRRAAAPCVEQRVQERAGGDVRQKAGQHQAPQARGARGGPADQALDSALVVGALLALLLAMAQADSVVRNQAERKKERLRPWAWVEEASGARGAAAEAAAPAPLATMGPGGRCGLSPPPPCPGFAQVAAAHN